MQSTLQAISNLNHHQLPDFSEQVTFRSDIHAQLKVAIKACRVQQDLRQSGLFKRCLKLLKQHRASLVAHYYVDANLQALAEASGGFVGDSLQMAQFGADSDADQIIVAGVRFMGESAKILSPHKTVRMVAPDAECSLDLSCQPEQFSNFCQQHPDREVVVYANTSAEIKAMADWVVTSSIALDVIDFLSSEGRPILWAPDKHLGRYLQQSTDADMLLWDGACVVHEEFKADAVHTMRKLNPQAGLLAHPESPKEVLELADAVGSTSQLINHAKILPHQELIVATDSGIFYKMQQAVPDKTLLIAPTHGKGASCKSCAHCPWMGLNDLARLEQVVSNKTNTIDIDSKIIAQAKKPLERMLDFSKTLTPT